MHARNWRITGGIARRLLSLVPFLPALVVASCADSPTAIDTDGDIQVAIVGGNAQTGIVGQMLTAPLVVRVGTVSAPVAGALVNFVVVRGGGQVWAGSALTAANGIARDFWILGTDTDSAQVVEVRAVRPNGTRVVYGTFTATPLADAAVAVERILGPPSAPELQLVTPAPGLRVSDRFGNPVTGHPVVFTVRRGGGSVSDTIATGSNGIALPEWIPGAYRWCRTGR